MDIAKVNNKRRKEREREIRGNLTKLELDTKLTDTIIKIGLFASALQLTVAFQYGDTLSWFIAGIKAAFIELTVWQITRAIVWGITFKLRGTLVTLWAILFIVFVVSVRANVDYEMLQNVSLIEAIIRSGVIPFIILSLIYSRIKMTTAAQQNATAELDNISQSDRWAKQRNTNKEDKEKKRKADQRREQRKKKKEKEKEKGE